MELWEFLIQFLFFYMIHLPPASTVFLLISIFILYFLCRRFLSFHLGCYSFFLIRWFFVLFSSPVLGSGSLSSRRIKCLSCGTSAIGCHLDVVLRL
jgi:hypothetical protein